jgi:hypothetical protein
VKTSPAVAKSYAKAIFELARERNQAEQVEGELERVATLVADDGQLAAVLSRPWVTPANKRKIAEEIGQRLELSKLGRDLLCARSPERTATCSTPPRVVSVPTCARPWRSATVIARRWRAGSAARSRAGRS